MINSISIPRKIERADMSILCWALEQRRVKKEKITAKGEVATRGKNASPGWVSRGEGN